MESETKSDQQFCLRWHNHQDSLLTSLPLLLNRSCLTDVTLSAEGKTVQAHRVVLSACSNFFADLFGSLEQSYHPVIILPGAQFPAVLALITFIYSGEANVFEEQIPGLLILAEALGIKGLADLKNHNKQQTNKILKINDENVQLFQFEQNAKNEQFMYTKLDEMKHSSKEMVNHDHDNIILQNDEAKNKNFEIRDNQILNNINNISQISEILRCLSSSSITVSDVANELSTTQSCSQRERKITEIKKTKDYINYCDKTNIVASNAFTASFPGDYKTNSSHCGDKCKPVECVKPITNSKLFATCFICQKQLSNQYNLRVHLETHQNVRYTCSVCPHVSRSKDALRKHVSYRHSANIGCFETERKRRSKIIGITPNAAFGQPNCKLSFLQKKIRDQITPVKKLPSISELYPNSQSEKINLPEQYFTTNFAVENLDNSNIMKSTENSASGIFQKSN